MIISRYYKTEEMALENADENQYVICAKNGYFVVSEKVAELCFPELNLIPDKRIKK